MTDEQTSREKLEAEIVKKLDSIHEDLENSELAEDSYVGGVKLHSDVIAKVVLDAIKEVGGVLLMPQLGPSQTWVNPSQLNGIVPTNPRDGRNTKQVRYVPVLSDNT